MRRLLTTTFFAVLAFAPQAQSARHESDHAIQRISLSRPSINPSSAELTTLLVTLNHAARLGVQIVDRDAFVIRTLAPRNGVAGENPFPWDGKDDRGEIVP